MILIELVFWSFLDGTSGFDSTGNAPDQEIETPDYSGLSEEVPKGIQAYIESLIGEQNAQVSLDILKKRALQDYDEDPVSEDDDDEEDDDDDIDYFS